MLYAVELPIGQDGFTDRMNQMRAWLDHRKFEPSAFRFTHAGQHPGECRVLFRSHSEAEAFAREFGGQVLYVATTTDVIR